MKGLKHLNLVDLVIIFTLGSTLLYAVANNIPGLGSFRWFWGPLCIFTLIISQPHILFNRIVLLSIIYGLLYLVVFPATIWSEMTAWNRTTQLEEFYGLFFSIFLISYFLNSPNVSSNKIIIKLSFTFIIITLIMTHIALFFDSNIVRDSANTFEGNLSRISFFKKTGTMGYGYAQAVVILIPILIYYIKKSSAILFSKKQLILILILCIILMIRANVFANLLVSTVITFLALVSSKSRAKTIIIMFLLGVILFIVPTESYIKGITYSKELFETESFMYQKLDDFSQFFLGPSTEDALTGAGNRASRYPMLFDALMEAPIYGAASNEFTSYQSEGGHLYFMNRLTQWGIPFFMFFVFLLYRAHKYISKFFNKEFKYYYMLATFAFVLLGLSKNIAGREPFLMLFFIIPASYLSIIQITKVNKKTKKFYNSNE